MLSTQTSSDRALSPQLQVVLAPPNARLPALATAPTTSGGGSDGGEVGGAAKGDADGGCIGASLEDLLQLERPTATEGAWEASLQAASGMPDDAPELLARLTRNVGGLNGQIATVVRRALASRLYPAALTRELGISPTRGVLLHGPPGCGKTLLAREITAALGAREPKIVSGPEMMSKYVGDSEAFIRGLFAEAELEQVASRLRV